MFNFFRWRKRFSKPAEPTIDFHIEARVRAEVLRTINAQFRDAVRDVLNNPHKSRRSYFDLPPIDVPLYDPRKGDDWTAPRSMSFKATRVL